MTMIKSGYKSLSNLLLILILLVIIGCSERENVSETTFLIDEASANSFLSYLNPQQQFSYDKYQLLVLPIQDSSARIDLSYQVELYYPAVISVNQQVLAAEYQEVYPSQWSDTPSLDWQNHNEILRDLDFEKGREVDVKIDCPEVCQLYIIKSGYLYQTAVSSTSTAGSHEVSLNLNSKLTSSLKYAQAYYAAVDENNERTTLSAWKTKNGFDQGFDVHVIFRDTKDLGYGRDMYGRKNADGSLAIYVNNFVVKQGESNPANYGPLNLLAATDQNFDYHLGSNAIEFSLQNEADPQSDKILKFFTFAAQDSNQEQVRITSADLDGRGIKHMPSMCFSCHGGTALPISSTGEFNPLSLASAKLNQLDVNSFEFLDSGVFSQGNQEAGIKLINQWIRDSYQQLDNNDPLRKGYWSSLFAQQLANQRYGDADFMSNSYQTEQVPNGWTQNISRPEGVENLYLQVIEPHCISCHGLQGYKAGDDSIVDPVMINGEDVILGNAINFSSYEKFISYSELIIDYVYRRGVMPLSLRNSERFWQPPYSAPALLASYLPNFDVLNELAEIQPPGLPVARIEAKRISASPLILHGGASYFSQAYQWQVISGPAEHQATISGEQVKQAQLTSDLDGDYVIRLTVSNDKGSHSTEQVIRLDSQNKAAAELNFISDIKPLLQSQLFNLRTCQSCHDPDVGIDGIPIHYDDTNTELYWDVRARINFSAPMDSLFLQKPTRLQHGGGVRIELDTELGLQSYSTLLSWILNGAPCGDDEVLCQFGLSNN
ncbi:MAG: hypothetical protein JKX82_04145 [Oleispira sp.]|nr:hypothetical protein [Oleispira sp.]